MNGWFKGRCSNCSKIKDVHKLKSVQICTACAGAVRQPDLALIIRQWKFPDIFAGKLPFIPLRSAQHAKTPSFFENMLGFFKMFGRSAKRVLAQKGR